jgi:endonuclease/exonuclease/phosphatase family metal-dependent hydrolase
VVSFLVKAAEGCRRKRGKLRVFAVPTAIAVSLAGATTGPASAQASQIEIPIVQFNMCGRACFGGGSGIAATVSQLILAKDAMAASLQEVCKGQFDSIDTTLRPRGYDSWFTTTVTGTSCGSYGIALFWKSSDNIRQGGYSVPLASDGTEARRLTCQKLSYQGALPWYMCSTHLTPFSATARQAQIADVARNLTVNLETGAPTVLGGDLNNLPYLSSTDQYLDILFHMFYGADFNDNWTSQGHLIETTGCCTQRVLHQFASTHASGKIDYIFLDPNFTARGASTLTVNGDDHKMLTGTMVFYTQPT